MAQIFVFGWGDGSYDELRVKVENGLTGNRTVLIYADENKTPQQRVRVIKFKAQGGGIVCNVTVTQDARSRAFSSAFNSGFK
jgi:hypothetical protein